MHHVFKKAVCRAKSGGRRWPRAAGGSPPENTVHSANIASAKKKEKASHTLEEGIDYGFWGFL